MIEDALSGMVSALASSARFDQVMPHVEQAFRSEIGFRLLTLTSIDRKLARPVCRLWSSLPDIYPVGGDKPLDDKAWSRQLIDSHRPVVLNTAQEVRDTFPADTPLEALGVGSGLNLPIVLGGVVLGTLNLFHEAQWFTPERVQRALSLLGLVYIPFLLAHCNCSAQAQETPA